MEMQENAILPYTNFTGAPANQITKNENQPVIYPVELSQAVVMVESAVDPINEPILQGGAPIEQDSAIEDHPAKEYVLPAVNIHMVESYPDLNDPTEIPYDISTGEQYLDASTLDQNTWDEQVKY